jgi:hypothetical protein
VGLHQKELESSRRTKELKHALERVMEFSPDTIYRLSMVAECKDEILNIKKEYDDGNQQDDIPELKAHSKQYS